MSRTDITDHSIIYRADPPPLPNEQRHCRALNVQKCDHGYNRGWLHGCIVGVISVMGGTLLGWWLF